MNHNMPNLIVTKKNSQMQIVTTYLNSHPSQTSYYSEFIKLSIQVNKSIFHNTTKSLFIAIHCQMLISFFKPHNR